MSACKHGVLWPDDSGCPVCNAEKNRAVPVSREVLEELRRDAARYRWLREHWFDFGTMANTLSKLGASLHAINTAGDLETLDAAIDAAMVPHD